MDNSRSEFVTVCCSVRHERGKQYFVQPFLRSMKLLRLTVRHTEVMSRISRAYGVDYASEVLCVICTVSEQPALVCHGPQLSCVR